MPGTMLAGGLCRSGRDTPCGDCHDLWSQRDHAKKVHQRPCLFVLYFMPIEIHGTRYIVGPWLSAWPTTSINIPASHVFHPRWHIRLKIKIIGHHLPAPASPLIPVADLLVLRLPSYWSLKNSYADSDTHSGYSRAAGPEDAAPSLCLMITKRIAVDTLLSMLDGMFAMDEGSSLP